MRHTVFEYKQRGDRDMGSRKNALNRAQKAADKQNRFSIRKLSVGAASVLIGSTFFLGNNANTAKADTNSDTGDAQTEESANSTQTEDASTDAAATKEASSDVVTAQTDAAAATSAQTNTDTNNDKKITSAADANLEAAADKNVEQAAVKNETAINNNSQAVKQNVQTQEASNNTTSTDSSSKTSTETKATTTKDVAADNIKKAIASVDSSSLDVAGKVAEVASSVKDETAATSKVDLNNMDLSEAGLKGQLTTDKTLGATQALDLQSQVRELSTRSAQITEDQLKAMKLAATSTVSANANVVTTWNGITSAINSGQSEVTVSGNITAQGDLNITSGFTIKGTDSNATLNLGSYKINNTSNLTLEDITVNGSVMGTGTVNINGKVTSNVSDSNGYNLTQSEKNEKFTNWSQTKGYNFQASTVNVEAGASLTVNRSSVGDGIHLVNSNAAVNVGDNASLTINMNTNNDLNTQARYHDAGIFAESTGNFTTGYKSVVTLNTSIGQGIAMTGTRPNAYDNNRFGGYTAAQSRPNGSGQINLGKYSTMNFTGRDGVILGNNSNFNVGDYANVHFENKGRGVALDLANNANINVGNHAVTYFHSVGKNTTNARGQNVGPSGSYDGYNYIGVNEGGNITIGEGATFRVILEDRGDNAWDDVVSLDSRQSSTTAAFTSKQGAIVDLRDDNTNFYAELISFPLGSANSKITIDDPLMLNLQRYSNGGATTGWMATGGDMINTTSSQYTANLIYMSSNKGVFSVTGGDYDPSNPASSGFVVYQQIKSDGSKQIWLNVNDVNIPMNGFQTKDIWNNGANPDVSISGNGLTGGIKANQVHNYDGTPLTGKDAPYYGISTQRASHQIWFPHRTTLQVDGSHTNTIKYVDEDGNEIFPESTQSVDLKRNLILDITTDKIEDIQKYALSHTADETLEYIKNSQVVTQDSGWEYTDAKGNTVTDPYSTVTSPKLDGYTATIESSNAPGITAGADGSSVTAKLVIDNDALVKDGELTDAYKNNGTTGIPANYETVVVYKKAVEKGSVKVVYHDDTTNTEIPNTEYNTGSVDAGTKVDYSTSTTISDLEKKGYVYVTTDGTIPSEITGNVNTVVTVHMKHGVVPVNPDTPTPDVPKTPDGKTVVDPANLTKDVNLTVNYVNSDGTTFTGTVPSNAKQTVTFTGSAYVDKVTGQLVNATQEDGKWVVDSTNTATPQITWTAKDGKTSFDAVISPAETGYHVASVSSHADGDNVAAITGLTKDSQNINITVTYDKNAEEKANLKIVDDTTGQTLNTLNAQGDENTAISFTNGDSIVQNYLNSGYKFVSVVNDQNGQTLSTTNYASANFGNFDTNPNTDQSFTVHLVHGTKPVNPDNPTDKYTKNDLRKQATRTINYVDSEGNKIADPVTSTVVFTASGTVDTVTGNLVNLNPDGTIKDQNGQLTWTYSVDGGAAQDGTTYTFGQTNQRQTIDYNGSTYNFTSVNPGNYNAGNGSVSSYLVSTTNPQDLTVNVIYNKQATYHTGKTETKEVTRTINYLDGKTGDKIPSNLIQNNPVSQTVNMHRTEIVDGNGNVLGYGTVSEDGKSYTINNDYIIDGNWASVTSPDLTANGYKAPRFENGSSAAEVAEQNVDQNTTNTTVNVYYDHNEIPVGPDTPDKHGVDPNELTKNVKETVHYVGAGDKTPADVVQNSKWTRTVTVDAVTNEIIPNGQYTTDWAIPNGEKTTYDQVNTPVVEGYYADQANVPATAVTQNDIEKTVTYKPVGNIIPVGPDGNPIPNVPSTPFPNDPTDPTKTTPGTKPDVPGYHPETGKPGDEVPPVPGNPGEDVKVPYVKDQGAVQVIFHDDTTNTTIPNVGYNSGDLDAGTKVDYTTTSTITDLEKQGYVYVRTDGTIPAEIPANENITVTVHMKHGVQPITPDTPTPDVPKNTPADAQPDQLTKNVDLNVTYVNADGTQFTGIVPANAKQTVIFTGTAYVDKITGQLVNAKQEDGKWVIDTDNTATPQITWTAKDGKTSFDAVISPAESGYHVTNVSSHADGDNVAEITGLTKDSSNINITVTYAKNGTETRGERDVKASQIVNYVDEQGNKLADSKSQDFSFHYIGDVYDTTTDQKISDGTWSATNHNFTAENVPVINGYVAVSGYTNNDGKYTAGGFTTTYDSTEAQRNRTFTVVYKKIGNIVPVGPDGKTPIPNPTNPSENVPNKPYTNDPTDPTKVTPNEPVPEIPGYTPSVPTVTPSVPTEDTPVIYTKNQEEKAKVQYIDLDDNDKVMSESNTLTGKAGETINYSTADEIAKYEKQGYVLVNDGFSGNPVFDNVDGNEQIFKVTFRHGQIPVGPDTPDKHGVDPNELSKDVKETVHYVGAGDKTPADVVQTSKWTRTVTVDAVTGEVVENGQYTTDWSIAKGEKTVYDQVDTPVVEGYHADKRQVNATAVTQDDIEVTVTYTPNGKIIPVDPSGKPIPNVPTPQYPTDPTDPTRVTPDEPVPNIPGYTPSVPTVTPTDPGKDTPVPYTPVTPAKDQAAVVNYVDASENNKLITSSGELTGKAGEKIDYSTTSTIQDLENKGYVLVNDGFPAGATFDNDDNTTQVYTVVLRHGTIPVTPTDPGKPGEPINPNDPDGPKWPEGSYENALKKTGTQTIHYVYADGTKAKDDNVQSFDFTKSAVVDKVTGKIISETGWNVSSHTFGSVDTPVIDGYHADKRTAGGTTITPDDLTKEVTVTYTPNGKIIPVDPSGKPIPNVPTPQYPTDPTDPTRVTPDEPVPNIPGYTPSVPTVTPTDPGKDTPVPYTPDVAKKGSISVIVHDTTDNVDLPDYGKNSGEQKAGTEFTYDKTKTITELTDKGYKVINPDVTIPSVIGDTAQTVTIYVEHTTTTVTPDKPGKPGEPVNPDNPDGPKYPDGTDENAVKRTGTQTIHYTGAGENTPKDNVQSFDFTRTITFDNVTGKIIETTPWNVSSHTFGRVDTPVVNYYHADKRIAGGETVTPDDLNKTVTVNYTPNGKIIPVDPNGNPIPNVPQPQYPTDPTDPTKVVPDEPVPNIPGMTPSTPTVTPTDPGKDTPVPYTPQTPVTPDTPQPSTPQPTTPQPQPETPATPATPETPAPTPNGQDVPDVPEDTPSTPDETVTPHATDDKTPSTPAKNVVPHAAVNRDETPVKRTVATEENKETKATLPQTGEDNNEAMTAAGLALINLISLALLAGADKKRRKKD